MTALGERERLAALELENRALRRANESLPATLAYVVWMTPPPPPGSGTRDVPDLPASSPAGSCGQPDERAGWALALEGEASWETVLVPRGVSR